MADSNFRGPIGGMGAMEAESAGGLGTTSNFGTAQIAPLDGVGYHYQGWATLDPHGYPFNKDGLLPGRAPGFLNAPNYVTIDAVPQAASTTALAAAQIGSAGNMTLVSAPGTNFSVGAASIAVGVPLIPQGTTVVTTVIAIDFGFTTGTTTANSTTVNTPDNSIFSTGQWIIIGNVANSSGTASLVTQVQSVSSNGTSLFVSPAPATALGAPIGGANLWGSNLLPAAGPLVSAPTANAVSPTLPAGVLRLANPREALARNVMVQASSVTGGTAIVTVTGWDLYGQLMTEAITASGTTLVGGKKAFKYIRSASISTTQVGTFSLGIADTFGFPFRCELAQNLQYFVGNTSNVNTAGVATAMPLATPATNTTADVRGTITMSLFATTNTPVSNQATTNNVLRLYVEQTPSLNAIINTNPNNLTPLFGVTNSTT